MFVALSFSGCNSFIDTATSKKCAVTVFAHAVVKYSTNELIKDISVRFDFSKDGGESFTFYRSSGETGYTDDVIVGYNLYKNQRITVIATATVNGEAFSTSVSFSYDSIPEDRMQIENPTYTWEPKLSIIVNA